MFANVTSLVVAFVLRQREEDYREIICQVHSWRKARHQNRQIGGQDTGKPLLLMGFFATITGMIPKSASILQTKQADACIMDAWTFDVDDQCVGNGSGGRVRL